MDKAKKIEFVKMCIAYWALELKTADTDTRKQEVSARLKKAQGTLRLIKSEK